MLFNSRANFSSYLILVPLITSKNFPSNCQSENQTHLFFHFLSAERNALQFSPPLRLRPFSLPSQSPSAKHLTIINMYACRLENADFSISQLTCKIYEGLFYFCQELKLSIMERTCDNDEWLDSWGTGSLPLWPVLSNES